MLTFSNDHKIKISKKISDYNFFDNSKIRSEEKDYLSSIFVNKFYKVSSYFFAVLFGMNLFLLTIIGKQLNYKFPYMANKEYITKMKKLLILKRIIFYSLIIYEIGFCYLAVKNYKQHQIMRDIKIHELEKKLIANNKHELEEYGEFFFSKHKQ